MTASPYCACRTAALRIFVRSLVGPAPSSTIAATLSLTKATRATRAAQAAQTAQTNAFSTFSSPILPAQWRTALRSDLRLGQTTTAVRAIHTSQRCAAQASQATDSNLSDAIIETKPTDEPAPSPASSTSLASSASSSSSPVPTTLGKNKRKKLRRRREAEAQAELILKELDAQSAQSAQSAQVQIPVKQESTEPAADAASDAASMAPKSTRTISDKRKLRKVLRAARRAAMNEAARKEELADQILSKKQRQARAKERTVKQLEKEASAKADEEAAAARAQRRKEKKLRGKAERLAVLAENDPGKYAEIEAKRVKREMKKERRAARIEKKRVLEEQSKSLRGVKMSLKSKEKEKKKEQKKDDKERENEKREPGWMVQKKVLKAKFPEGWKPRKKLSPDALEGIRALNRQLPETYTTAVLAQHFEISPEAVRRILKSKWKPAPEEEEERQMRWFERGRKVWTRWAALGKKPPKQWRREGILRDASWTGSRKRAQEAREAYADQQTRLAKLKEEQPHLLRGKSRRVYEREQAEKEGKANDGAQKEPKREGGRDRRRDTKGRGRGRGRGRDSGQDKEDVSFPSEW